MKPQNRPSYSEWEKMKREIRSKYDEEWDDYLDLLEIQDKEKKK